VQRELIRKIGAERVLKACNAKTIDDWIDPNTGFNYKLMDMQLANDIQNIQRMYLYFEHASMPGIYYAKPIPPECDTAWKARAWIVSLIERDELSDITIEKEAEIIANLPAKVS